MIVEPLPREIFPNIEIGNKNNLGKLQWICFYNNYFIVFIYFGLTLLFDYKKMGKCYYMNLNITIKIQLF